MRFLRLLLLTLLACLLAACSSLVPANTPLQLEATAGLSILITDEIVDAGLFTVDYPDGWRVVKLSIAGAPIHLVFAAPDESSMWIEIYETPMPRAEATTDASFYERFDYASHLNYVVFFRGIAPIEQREEFDVIYQQVVESIQFR